MRKSISQERRRRRERRHLRVRKKVTGTAERPRLVVYRSLKHIYAQLVDDTRGVAIMGVSESRVCQLHAQAILRLRSGKGAGGRGVLLEFGVNEIANYEVEVSKSSQFAVGSAVCCDDATIGLACGWPVTAMPYSTSLPCTRLTLTLPAYGWIGGWPVTSGRRGEWSPAPSAAS